MIPPVPTCEHEVDMKHLPTPTPATTELWRFPIMGEETWAGVDVHSTFPPDTSNFHPSRKFDHVTQTQQFTQFTQDQS
jgi:hypothetical protein